jgi:hypothetical protein
MSKKTGFSPIKLGLRNHAKCGSPFCFLLTHDSTHTSRINSKIILVGLQEIGYRRREMTTMGSQKIGTAFSSEEKLMKGKKRMAVYAIWGYVKIPNMG